MPETPQEYLDAICAALLRLLDNEKNHYAGLVLAGDETIARQFHADVILVAQTLGEILLNRDRDELYRIAREVCHDFGMDWTDPRTGKTYPAPSKDIPC